MQFLRFVCYTSFRIPLCLIRFLLTGKVSKSYFTLRYLFINHLSWNPLCLYYTGSSFFSFTVCMASNSARSRSVTFPDDSVIRRMISICSIALPPANYYHIFELISFNVNYFLSPVAVKIFLM